MAGGIRTIRDLQREADSHGNDDNDEDLDHRLYTGNGLNVDSNPTGARPGDTREQLLRNLMREAAQQGSQADRGSQHFQGDGQTVGDDESPGQTILGAVTRRMTIWRNGFSFDDGRFIARDENDPRQLEILKKLDQHQIPVEWFEVQPGQEVVLELSDKRMTDYQEAAKEVSAFAGTGYRFAASGSSTPRAEATSSTSTQTATTSVVANTTAAPSYRPTVDPSIPKIRVRFTLPSGMHTIEFNTIHTTANLYDFVAGIESGPFRLVSAQGAAFENTPTLLSEVPSLAKGGIVRFNAVQ